MEGKAMLRIPRILDISSLITAKLKDRVGEGSGFPHRLLLKNFGFRIEEGVISSVPSKKALKEAPRAWVLLAHRSSPRKLSDGRFKLSPERQMVCILCNCSHSVLHLQRRKFRLRAPFSCLSSHNAENEAVWEALNFPNSLCFYDFSPLPYYSS